MTSKELVPLEAGKDLAIIEDRRPLVEIDENSPCPRFDRQVKTIAVCIDNLARDRSMFPEDRKTEREHYEYTLRKLVNDVESGEWSEPMPEPEQDGAPTLVLQGQKPVEELTPEWVDEHWDAMTRRNRWDWLVDRYVEK